MQKARAFVTTCVVFAALACGDRSSLLAGRSVATTSPAGTGTVDAGQLDAAHAGDANTCPPDVCPVILATGGHPYAIAVSASQVYWTDDAHDPGGSVDRVPIGGGTVVTIARTVGSGQALAVDTHSVYWTDSGTSAAKKDGSVMSAPLIGGKPKTLRSKQTYPTTLAVEQGILYWGSSSHAKSARALETLDVVEAEDSVVVFDRPFATTGMVAIDDDVFFTYVASPNVTYPTIGLGSYDGEGGGVAYVDNPALGPPTSVAADATLVYWTNRGGSDASGSVLAAPYLGAGSSSSGMGVNVGSPVTLATHQSDPDGVAVDASGVYWTTGGLDATTADGTVEWLAPGATMSVSIAAHQAAPHRVALDGTNVYWTNGGVPGTEGSVMQLAKRVSCEGGTCACPAGETMCSTGCADTSSDITHCGSCGTPCGGSAFGPGLCEAGHCIVTLARGPAFGLSLGGGSLYWTSDRVLTMPLAGGAVTTLGTNIAATTIAADASGAIWLSPVPSVEGTAGVLVIVPDQSAGSLAIDSTYAYWANPTTQAIDRIVRSGGAPEVVVANMGGVGGVAVDATAVYWTGDLCPATSSCTSGVFKTPLAGGTTLTIASTTGELGAVAIDASSVYWIDDDAILAAPIIGGTPVTVVDGLNEPACLAIDASFAYVGTAGSIVKAPLSGGSAEMVAPAITNPTAIAVDDDSVYWADDLASNTGTTGPMPRTDPTAGTVRKATK